MNEQLPILAKKLIKVHTDEKFGRISQVESEAAIKAITDEGTLCSIGKNEILTNAMSNSDAYKKQLEKEHGIEYIDK